MTARGERGLRATCARLGCTVEVERIHNTITVRVEAPAGHRFAPDLHEIVDTCFAPWKPDYDDLIERVEGYGTEPCDDPECEWCNETEEN